MNLRYSGMAFASSVKEVKGEGNLPKLVLTSTHGRYVFVNCISLLLFVRHLAQYWYCIFAMLYLDLDIENPIS